MCGICCICSLTGGTPCHSASINEEIARSFLTNRGPDSNKSIQCVLWDQIPSVFAGFVLHLRGSLTPQPVTNEEGDILLWNGEIFDGVEVGETENDSKVLFDRLVACTCDGEVMSLIQTIQGPWSIIFWQAEQKKLWFGRDVFGRRSLLWHLPGTEDDVFALSSVAIKSLEYDEVPSVGMFCLQAGTVTSMSNSEAEGNQFKLQLHLFPWQRAVWPGTSIAVGAADTQSVLEQLNIEGSQQLDVVLHSHDAIPSWMPVLNKQVPDPVSLTEVPESWSDASDPVHILQEMENSGELALVAEQLICVLEQAVRKRVYNLPRHRGNGNCYSFVEMAAGDASASPGYAHENSIVTGLSNAHLSDPQMLPSACSTVQCELSSVNHSVSATNTSDAFHASEQASCEQTVNDGQAGTVLSNTSSENTGSDLVDSTAHIAILFSGGVDSSMLAALVDRCLPLHESVDLINVAFEQKEAKATGGKRQGVSPNPGLNFNVPDRQTGHKALSELNPRRQWNFVEVNVTQEMLQKGRSERVRHLLYPLTTVLDDSIGCAVWFAARGRGVLGNGPHKGQPYVSKARVILCGMGADEQLAGYSRHRVRFKQEAWTGLNTELEMEINRISARNLGRDDRIITDHGKESRFPFLDERVVAFLASVPVHQKADLRLPRGVGEKLLLRLAARRLGLRETAALPKRAIQFGSRIAKMEQSKEKGSQVCQRLVNVQVMEK